MPSHKLWVRVCVSPVEELNWMLNTPSLGETDCIVDTVISFGASSISCLNWVFFLAVDV